MSIKNVLAAVGVAVVGVTGAKVSTMDVFATTIHSINEQETLTQTITSQDTAIVQLTPKFEDEKYTYKSYGTGVFISDNVILTAAHVLRDDKAKFSHIEFHHNGKTYYAYPQDVTLYNESYKSSDADDMAIIRVRLVDKHANLQLSEETEKTKVHIIGYPADKDEKPDLNVGRPYESHGETIKQLHGLWYTTAYTLPGMSGAPLLNEKNEIIGLHVGKATTEDMIDRKKKFSTSIRLDSKRIEWLQKQIKENASWTSPQ